MVSALPVDLKYVVALRSFVGTLLAVVYFQVFKVALMAKQLVVMKVTKTV